MDPTYNLNGAFKPTVKRNADLAGADFFPTPPWATHALMENEPFVGDTWECACGDGAMAGVIEKYSKRVISSDLYDRGFGDAGIDFLQAESKRPNIVTNPPYNAAQGFVEKAAELAENKFALLLRLAFLEGAGRAKTIFTTTPPSRVWVFSERITFYPKGARRAGSGTTAYAWFVWDKSHQGGTELKWLQPGYRKKYAG
ncbi:hypothetical protein [Polycladidibacter hongkongensis]|uniref:hypothetical protein n=1 Tax=Polycladidibacter hongkongensis TaxID=1647556 RepID=UPI00082E61D5|nr:hypothetical protein [Pseudovibrio hongkongensis]